MDIAAKLIPRLFALLMLMAALCAASLYSPRANAQTPTTGCAVAHYCGFWQNKSDAQAQCQADALTLGTLTRNCADSTASATVNNGLTYTKGFWTTTSASIHYFYFYYCNAGQSWDGSSCVALVCADLLNPVKADYVGAWAANPVDDATHDPLLYLSSDNKCIGGCTYALRSGDVENVTVNGNLVGLKGFFAPTGVSCGTTSTAAKTPPPADNPVCITYATGQKMCIRNDQYCYTASTLREICWAKTQTGDKTDGPIDQRQVAGSSSVGPPPPPPGETYAQSGSSATTVTSDNSPSSTTTTNTTNYVTQNGTNAGTTNQGQTEGSTPTTTTTTTSTSSSATGGSCAGSYTCSSSNGVECAMLEEQRKARCSIESEKAGVTGGTTCATAPACSGDKCNADAYHIILQAWKTRCAVESSNTKLDGISSSIAAGNGKLDALKGSVDAGNDELGDIGASVASINSAVHSDGGTPDGADDDDLGPAGTAEAQGFGEEVEYGDQGLDDSGFGLPRTCPSPPTFQLAGHTFVFDMTYICFAPSIESALLLMLVGIWCLMFIVKD